MTNLVDRFQYKDNLPQGFNPVAVHGGIFSHPIRDISETETIKQKQPDGTILETPKIKYGFVLAVPFDNLKLQLRETEFLKFSCSKDDYDFLSAHKLELDSQAVYVTFLPNSWATSKENSGVWYQYVSGSLIRFDGKNLLAGKK